ncbi:unnamed protein product [Parnassius apollo]|uniref:(apollo) hypothetical protein n=1 Tax=Parnassius apollo TaxID=110799 RepID=A0A8S3X1Y9_PARAO|nr:unnamed protein product [Parnassius apollo]
MFFTTLVLDLFYSIAGVYFVLCHMFDCHDDAAFDPDEGTLSELQFNWLGALQYIHVKAGTPHYYRVPRVSLITKQFVLSTAKDAAQIPEGYALGNVVFGEYERDESECKVAVERIAGGMQCDPAVLLMPIADVLLHPEYKHFGVKSSIALLKLLIPIKSRYMLPACLPYKDYLQRNGKQLIGLLIYVDFASEVPRDFVEEEKEVLYLETLSEDQCVMYDDPKNVTHLPQHRYLCTTRCDLQSGAPTLFHEHTGHWNIVALSEGGTPCPDPLRYRGRTPPSRHIRLHPYVPWITTAISGKPVGAFAKDDPFGYIMPRAVMLERTSKTWLGHWWMGGIRCYDRGDAAQDMYRFYHEIFQIYPDATSSHIIFYLEIYAPSPFKIICVKVGMPYQMANPMVWDLNTGAVKLRIPVSILTKFYQITIEAWMNNGTAVREEAEPGEEEEEGDEDASSSEDGHEEEEGEVDEEGERVDVEGRNKGKVKKPKKDKKGKDKGKGKEEIDSDISDEEALKPPADKYESDPP